MSQSRASHIIDFLAALGSDTLASQKASLCARAASGMSSRADRDWTHRLKMTSEMSK